DVQVCLIHDASTPPRLEGSTAADSAITCVNEAALTDSRLMKMLGVPLPEPSTGAAGGRAADGEALGDVDLVEAMLTQGASLEETVLKLVTQQSDITGVGITRGDATPPESHVAVNVIFRGRKLGTLHAPPPVTSGHLQPWADWLARWLALDLRMKELNQMALRDDMTGAWNRRYFNRFLNRILKRAGEDRSQVTLMVFDIDDFKLYNDRYGHAAGDEILREAARLMQSVVREHDVVARIGGDEFAVIFWDAEGPRRPNSKHPQDVVEAARRFRAAICKHSFPKLLDQAPATLTISGGLASFPWDGRTAEQLLERADAMAMQSKRQGKNAITFGPGAESQCEVKSL
ncbi:MAG: GGDEF domain-containing protein, partial [Rhodospirillales bacterium]|nr:GGDEF domain-containing protein [Rhodospirillales bacterium]